jgi:hypothetical protein
LERVGRLHDEASTRLDGVARELAERERVYAAESRDVATLEGRTLTAAVTGVLGTRQKRLARERAAAEAARRRRDATRARHGELTAELVALRRERTGLANARDRYERALVATEAVLAAEGDPRATELAELARRSASIRARLRGFDAAYRAGQAALAEVDSVLRLLGGATEWSRVDIGTGVLADVMEHRQLGRAEEAARSAQRALDDFAGRLADIGERQRPRLPPIDNRWFADVLFDNIITDTLRHNRIRRNHEQVFEVVERLRARVGRLRRDCLGLVEERAAVLRERERLHGLPES